MEGRGARGNVVRIGPAQRIERGAAAFVGLIGLLASASAALASNAIEPIGVSVQARARGGTDVAVGDTALSQIENPATLTLLQPEVYRLDASGQVMFSHYEWSRPLGSADSENNVPPFANVGLAMPVNEKLRLGLAFHSKSGVMTRYHIRHTMMAFTKQRVMSDMKNGAVVFNAAYQVTPKLSLGAGVRAELLTAKYDTVLGSADIEFGRGYAIGGGYQVGLHYQSREDLAFGLAYRSPSWFPDLSGGEGKAILSGAVPVSLGDINQDEPRLPQRIAGGVAWDATDWLKLIGEIRWINYSNSLGNSATYATDGLVDLRLPVNLEYDDQWVFAVGSEFKLSKHWRLGLGYNYGTNPISPSRVMPISANAIEHHITTGLRYETERWWVGGGCILGIPASVTSDPVSLIPLGIDYGFGTIRHVQHSIFFGFGYSW